MTLLRPPTPKPRKRDPREIALRVLSAYLTAGRARPLADRTPMPAPPRGPAGGVAFPRAGLPPLVPPRPGSPPPVPFPALPAAAVPAPAGGRPSAMEVIARFIEASRARGGRA